MIEVTRVDTSQFRSEPALPVADIGVEAVYLSGGMWRWCVSSGNGAWHSDSGDIPNGVAFVVLPKSVK